MLRHPCTWLTLGLAATAAAGVAAIDRVEAPLRDPDQFRWFRARYYCQVAFDSVSAACGAGLLTRDYDRDYTHAGRRVLLAVAHAGALLFLAAAVLATRGVSPERLTAGTAARGDAATTGAAPATGTPVWRVAAAFLLVEGVVVAGVALLGRAFCPAVDLADAALLVASAFCSLGCVPRGLDLPTASTLGLVGLVSAAGWGLWLLAVPAWRRAHGGTRGSLRIAAAYLALLFGAGAMIAAFEAPRGGASRRTIAGDAAALDDATFTPRLARGIALAVNAATTGIEVEPVATPAARDSSRFVLAGLVLVGGMGGSLAGAVRFPLFLLALGAVLAWLRPRAGVDDARARRVRAVAASHAAAAAALTLVVTIGLLAIETFTASPYQPAPTFADALLDAASAVGGAGLTSGLTTTVTSPNLTGGIGQPVDLFWVGMTWLALAMFAGRVLTILALRRLASAAQPGAGLA